VLEKTANPDAGAALSIFQVPAGMRIRLTLLVLA
jgi:hypothetical protein